MFTSHELFVKYDTDKDNHLTMNDVARAFYEISKKTTSLPAVSRRKPFVDHLLMISSRPLKWRRNRVNTSARNSPVFRSSMIP